MKEKSSNLIAKIFTPFSQAETIASYSNRAYLLIGLPIVCLSLFFIWYAGLLNYTVGQFPNWAQQFLKIFGARIGLSEDLKDFSLFLLILIIYLIILLITPVRVFIGKLIGDIFFGFIEFAIEAGEWCLDHRRISAFLIIFLSMLLTYGLFYKFSADADKKDREKTLQIWIDNADEFMSRITMSRATEKVYYERVDRLSKNAFGSEISNTHPAKVLHNMLDNVYGTYDKNNNEYTWFGYLKTKTPILEELIKREVTEETNDNAASQARSLSHLLIARTYVRVFEDAFSRPETNSEEICNNLIKAKNHFDTAKQVAQENSSSGWSKAHLYSIQNGLGTVYVNVFTIYINEQKKQQKDPKYQELRSICGDIMSCVENSRQSYEEAGKDYPSCSREKKREINNLTDLLMRLGMNYDIYSNPNTTIKISRELTVEELIQQINSSTGELLKCNDTEPLLTNHLVTAFQAYATVVHLKIRNSEKTKTAIDIPEIQSAAFYLRLSFNFDSKNLPDWDLTPFCFVLKEPDSEEKKKLLESFFQALEQPIIGYNPLPRQILLKQLKGGGKCQ